MNQNRVRYLLMAALAALVCLASPAANSTSAREQEIGIENTPPGVASMRSNDAKEDSAEECWLLAYFRQRYEGRVEIDADGTARQVPLPNPMREERLHFALSTNGRQWTPLNGNRPVWDQWLRDPFIARGVDGRWHLLATGGRPIGPKGTNQGPACLHATSSDLLKWEGVQSLWLMSDARDENGRMARNIWAPEWFLDHATGDIVVFWSSSFEDAGWKQSRLWMSRTRDWRSFTPAKVMFNPPYSVIDGTLLMHEGTYYLFHKEEEFSPRTGERRAIRVATADKLEGPYRIHEGPLNNGQIVPVITEGPAVMPDPKRPGWLLLYDYCMSNDYGVSASTNLLNWSVEPSTSMPPDARHGSVSRLTAAEAALLRSTFK